MRYCFNTLFFMLIFTSSCFASAKQIIIFVWDGLRPDSISMANTPNLYQLSQEGTYFADNHSSYPTFTMMNSASFATGDRAGKTGFFGNTLWNPKASGSDSSGAPVNFKVPVFTEDYKILQDLNTPPAGPLLYVTTLFEQAHLSGIKTAVVGKSGAAFLQDYQQNSGMNGIIVDEKHVYPEMFAKMLQQEGYPLPVATAKNNVGPTAFSAVVTLKDGVTSDPTATNVSPYSNANQYLMTTYVSKILPTLHPTLSVIWLRNPDTTEHNYGVGSASYMNALKSQDQLLGVLEQSLKQQNEWADTDLIVVSDHAHSNVSGPLALFPLRAIQNGSVTTIDPQGFSVSGDFRPADLLTRAGFHAYDGQGSKYDPVLSGIKADGSTVYSSKTDQQGELYTTPAYNVPDPLPKDAIIVAGNGGSTYFYVPHHNPKLVAKLVRYLQSREEFDVIFVNDQYPNFPGTLPMPTVRVENEARSPAVIAGSSYDANAVITGMKGIEFNSSPINRGMHGSFSPIDVHNTLLAYGPDFKSHFVDTLPTGNVDVPVTIAYLLHLNLPDTDGRPLLEALNDGMPTSAYEVQDEVYQPQKPAMHLVMQLPTDPNGRDIDKGKSNYTMKVYVKDLTIGKAHYLYFDSAEALRY